MAKIYRRTDRVSVKIGDVTVKLAPLSSHEKAEIQQAMILGRAKGDIREATRGMVLSLKYAIKGIEGVIDSDGNPYTLKFENDQLTDSCVDDLLNMELTERLALICAALVKGIPDQFTDNNGVKLEGVEIVNPTKSEASNPN